MPHDKGGGRHIFTEDKEKSQSIRVSGRSKHTFTEDREVLTDTGKRETSFHRQ